MKNFDLKKYLVNDKGLLNFLQQNIDEVVSKVADRDNHTPAPKFEFDGDGDVSIEIAYPDMYSFQAYDDEDEDETEDPSETFTYVYAFRKPEDVDHIGPLGIPFRNEGDADPEPIKIAGKDLMYISYELADI